MDIVKKRKKVGKYKKPKQKNKKKLELYLNKITNGTANN
jgi:hypothetical protein